MAVKLLMPKLGLNMVEGQITEWLKKEGDAVEKGEVIYIVETDKVTNGVEAPKEGVLFKILVDEGQVVPVRKIVGILVDKGEQVDIETLLDEDVSRTEMKEKTEEKNSSSLSSQPTLMTAAGQALASPLAKRMAAEHGIDLAEVEGSGAGGRIKTEDIEKIIAERGKSGLGGSLSGKVIPLAGVRKVVAERMSMATRTMAMVTLNSELDVTPMVQFREKMKQAGQEIKEIPSYNAILILITARALSEFPYLNASLTEDRIVLLDAIHIGLAIDTSEGLKVVVMRNANQKSMAEIHRELTAMIERAHDLRSLPEDLRGSTFTISNLGMYGVDSFNPIINPPESGILGVGRFKDKEVLEDGNPERKQVATFSLTFDHRVIDGAPAARFLQRLEELIADSLQN